MSEVQKAPTITIKPSDEIIKVANNVVTVVAGSMTIGLKKPNVLRHYQIVKVVGADAKNEVYMGMVMPLLWIISIDGDDMPPIGSNRELEALISRIGEDGINAVVNHLNQQAEPTSSEESIKNS